MNATTLKRTFGESVTEVADSCREEGSDERKEADASDTVSPCPPAEDLKDFLGSKKTFKSGEEKRAVLITSALADTLPPEDFLEAGDLLDCLKKNWRKPAAPLLRRQSAQLQTELRAGDTHQSFIDIQACGTFLDREHSFSTNPLTCSNTAP